MQKIKWDHELLEKLAKASNRSKECIQKEIKYLIAKLNIDLTEGWNDENK
ncbi:MAG: hypothetical protein QW702_08780 [Candidatus Bathyarchaeia archaeon]